MEVCVIAHNRADSHKSEAYGRIEMILLRKVEAMWIIFFTFAFEIIKRIKNGREKRQGTRH